MINYCCRWERRIGEAGNREIAPQAIEKSIINRDIRKVDIYDILGHRATDLQFFVDEELQQQLAAVFSEPRPSFRRVKLGAGCASRRHYLLLRDYLSGKTNHITAADENPLSIDSIPNALPDFLSESLFSNLVEFYSDCYGDVSEEKLDNVVSWRRITLSYMHCDDDL